MPYKDLRQYLRVLEEKGKLFRIAKEVDKDWELSAVAKLVFRKIPDERRPALLFENVKGFSLDGPVSDERRALGSKIGIDATRKHNFPPIAFPPSEHVLEVEKRWEEYGLHRIS